MNRRAHRLTERKPMGRWADGWTDVHMGGLTEGRTNGQAGRQAGRWMDGQTVFSMLALCSENPFRVPLDCYSSRHSYSYKGQALKERA